MRNKILLHISIALLSFAFANNNATAQCDTIASICTKHLENKFISDGQSYRSLLLEKEIAEFHATLFGGTTYRFSACSGITDGNLIFSVYDKERNLLFKNSDFKNSPYWDFKISSTIECIIEAELVSGNSSGCAVLLISFKQ
ncbi:MAG: hypothetical protein M3Q58_05015 [Bacteroidota bacterium]|nr:hypothetical protein [Bacteroidota bacterium]